MRKLAALGMMTLTLTSMISVTANAAVSNPFGQCYGSKNVIAIGGNSNLSDLKSQLQQLGLNGDCYDWLNNLNGSGNGSTGSNNSNTGTDTNTNTGTDTNTNTGTDTNTNTGTDDTTSDDSQTDKSYAQQVVDLVNVERAKEGLSPLTIDASVAKAATVRANEIQTKFDHTRPNGTSFYTALQEQGVSYSGAGENIAWGQSTPEAVVTAWMNSAGHRANILNANYTHIGVGNTQNSSGTQYWVQLFTY